MPTTSEPMRTSATMRIALAGAVCLTLSVGSTAPASSRTLPPPQMDSVETGGALQSAVLAGGCFWGVELVFEHVQGVQRVTSGYSGGARYLAWYPAVVAGETGHAEAVEIVYDPQQISYEQLLQIFFAVAHDPTQLNRQGPDTGTQYRSTLFYADAAQERVARAYIEELQRSQAFASPIVTTLEKLKSFHPAEAEHQDYAIRNPRKAYVVANDLPKLAHLQQAFPERYRKR